jgi:hypothetical protein
MVVLSGKGELEMNTASSPFLIYQFVKSQGQTLILI